MRSISKIQQNAIKKVLDTRECTDGRLQDEDKYQLDSTR